MINSPNSLVLRSRSGDSITNPSASFTICSSLLIGTGRFSQAQQTIEHFLSIEFLPAAVLLDHHVGDFVDALVSGEALAALQTLAAPADGIGFLALARVHHLVIFKTTERTLHDAGNWCNCNRGVFNRRLGAVCRSVTTTHEGSIELPTRNRSIRWKRRKAVCWSPLRAGSLPTAYGTTIFRDAPAPIPAVPPQQTSPARA